MEPEYEKKYMTRKKKRKSSKNKISNLTNTILSILKKERNKSFNYKQIAAKLDVNDANSRNKIIKTLAELAAKKQINEVKIISNSANQLKNKLKNKISVAEGIFLARDLVNEPSNVLNPEAYAKRIKELSKFGLKVEVLNEGNGAVAEAGQSVSVHYTGWLTDGTKFDSSVDRGQPFQFPLGAGRVIQGWDKGVQGMKVGEKRKLTIPPEMGYGARGAGGVIPPNATLVFEVELLGLN